MKFLKESLVFVSLAICLCADGAVLGKSPSRANHPVGALYIEVNNVNFKNGACYSVSSNGAPLFDIAIIFAANINFDTSNRRAYLHFNENVQTVLSNVNTYVRPVQARGTKVLLSILGNHQGAGICNFASVEEARAFAQQLNQAVRDYGLDGIDFDDEYAGYGNNGTPQPNGNSFLWLLSELRALMPDKLITFYYYGPAASRLENNEHVAGNYLDYSWNAIYGSYNAPAVPGLSRNELGPAAVWVGRTSSATARSLAVRTVSDSYGVYLYYDLPNSDSTSFLSSAADGLYGSASSLTDGNCLGTWPPPGSLAERGPRESMRKNLTTF